MAEDLVARLRREAAQCHPMFGTLYGEAADELARLRAALKQIADAQGNDDDIWAVDMARTALAAHETTTSPWCGDVHSYGPGFTCRKLRGHIGPHGCHDATGQLCEWPVRIAEGFTSEFKNEHSGETK